MDDKKLRKIINNRYYNIKILSLILRFAPFVKLILLTGSATHNDFKASSDIDFLIITQKKRLYTARVMVFALSSITGLKRNKNSKIIHGRFCFNYFMSENFLYIPKNRGQKVDVICAKSYLNSIPLIGKMEIFEQFKLQNYSWLKKIVQKNNLKLNFSTKMNSLAIKSNTKDPAVKIWIEKILSGNLGQKIEEFLMRYQKSRILSDYNAKKHPTLVSATLVDIRLHPPKK